MLLASMSPRLERCMTPRAEGNEALQMGSHGHRKHLIDAKACSSFFVDPTEYPINHLLVQLSAETAENTEINMQTNHIHKNPP